MSVKYILGDAVGVLEGMPAASVDSVVTSPPYSDARGDDYPAVGLGEYAEWTGRWAAAALPVVAETGSLMLNLGRRWVGGRQSRYHLDALAACEAAGWVWLDEIVWVKGNANPLGTYLVNAHEYVFWLVKNPRLAYRGYDSCRTPYAPESLARLQRGWDKHTAVKGHSRPRVGRVNPLGARPRSVVNCDTGREKGNPHPAPMPLRLAEHLVKLSTPAGGVVLNPFGGSGTVSVAAESLGRDSVLIEIEERWMDVARTRLAAQ